MNFTVRESSRCFGGVVEFYSFTSAVCDGEMRFSAFIPPQAAENRCPVLLWLSGLTCTDENFMTKAGAQRLAAAYGLILVVPDTSPRETGIAEATASYDLGEGAGFYVNATKEPWRRNFQMYDFVTNELPEVLKAKLPWNGEPMSISGHSMGGHGALVLGLRNPKLFNSISAFAPIASPVNCEWGQKAFSAYLGDDRSAWLDYDATELMKKGISKKPLLVDQGSDDKFLKDQLKPDLLVSAANNAGHELNYRERQGYDHSYYFVASFIEDHLSYHARHHGLL